MLSEKICPVCSFEATTRPAMLAHLRYYTQRDKAHSEYAIQNKSYKCPVCDFRAEYKNGVGSHIQQQSAVDKKHLNFYNEQKNLVWSSYERKVQVKDIAEDSELYFAKVWVNKVLKEKLANVECIVCKEKFRDIEGLKSHLAKQEDQEHLSYKNQFQWSSVKYNKLEKCPVCDHESVWLNKHMRMRWTQGDKEHCKYIVQNYKKCPVCEDMFENHTAIAGHFKKMDDPDHVEFMGNQYEKIKECFRQGLSILDISKKGDIYIKDLMTLSGIIKVEFSDEQIKKQRYKVMVQKNVQHYVDEPQRREQASLKMQGSNNPSWKGGAGEFYRGSDWRTQQRLALKTYGPECACCNQKSYNGTKTQVHHVIPYRICKSNDISLLRILCMRCHKIVENRFIFNSIDDSLVTLEYGLKIIDDVKREGCKDIKGKTVVPILI